MIEHPFIEIIELIKKARSKAFSSVNTELINLYWHIGEYIHKRLENSEWGEKKVNELADFIKSYYPELKGFNRRSLYRMKQFYETYFLSEIVSSMMTQKESRDIRQSLLTKISWTHHLTLISRTKTEEEREFYLRLCVEENYTVRELDRQINNLVFERTLIGNSKLPLTIKESHPNILNNFKDPYIFEFLNLQEPYDEKDVKKGLIQQMKKFILELGKDFLFIGEEYRVQVGNRDFYIDLLFYHRGLQCLIAFELKNDKFEPEHLGKLNFYLEALDRDVKKQNENPSIGILLCKDKDSEVVEYALSRSLSPTLVSEYTMQLPDKKLLQQKLHEIFSTGK